jgi:hypothetical protein
MAAALNSHREAARVTSENRIAISPSGGGTPAVAWWTLLFAEPPPDRLHSVVRASS